MKPIIKEAWEAWEEDAKTNPNPVNPYAFVYGYEACALNRFGGLDLDELRSKVLDALENETPETLQAWLNKKRQ